MRHGSATRDRCDKGDQTRSTNRLVNKDNKYKGCSNDYPKYRFRDRLKIDTIRLNVDDTAINAKCSGSQWFYPLSRSPSLQADFEVDLKEALWKNVYSYELTPPKGHSA